MREPSADWADTPNWRDNPSELDQLCDDGARQLHGTQPTRRDIATVHVKGDYL